jgi:hypothetical protein
LTSHGSPEEEGIVAGHPASLIELSPIELSPIEPSPIELSPIEPLPESLLPQPLGIAAAPSAKVTTKEGRSARRGMPRILSALRARVCAAVGKRARPRAIRGP